MTGLQAAVTREDLERDLHERVFAPRRVGGVPARRIGAEVELIPVVAATGERVPIDAADGCGSLSWLRGVAVREGWREEICDGGGSIFRLGDGGVISFEPGGQVEYSSPPYSTADRLLSAIEAVTSLLRRTAADRGLELLAIGLDPLTPAGGVPLQLHSERYERMAAYLARRGCTGAMMMRHSASFQLNLDFENEPLRRWELLNAAAPYVIAMFANSPLVEGRPTGHQSARAHVWRELDPLRTGVLATAGDAVAAYLDFALDAPMLLGAETQEYPVARAQLERRLLDAKSWHRHLTTLFPEVRPRGWMEVRSPDAIDPQWAAAPVALLAGLVYHAPSMAEAETLVAPPDESLLRRAGRLGLGDPTIAAVARDLAQIALDGCTALGAGFIGARNVEVAREYVNRYTARGLSPASEVLLSAGYGSDVSAA